MRVKRATRARVAGIAALLVGSACGGHLADGVYSDGAVAFRVASLPRAWQRQDVDGSLAWHHTGGGTIAAHGSCDRADDVPLDVLTNHLLIGMESRRERARSPLVVDGRTALRTRVDAELDGAAVALDLVVVKKNGCVYDLTLVAAPAAFVTRDADFDRFVADFAVRRP